MNIISIYYIYVLYVYTYPGVDNIEYLHIYKWKKDNYCN